MEEHSEEKEKVHSEEKENAHLEVISIGSMLDARTTIKRDVDWSSPSEEGLTGDQQNRS
jgi:hypothetical protein